MNDRGKSDSRVVPAKLANKTGQPAAELVEERRLTKGNTDQHNASRTQSRDVDASSALGRVRRVAQQDRETRFTALLHHVTPDRLRTAYWALNPRAAAGADGVTWVPTGRTWRPTSRICTVGSTAAPTGRDHREGCTYRRRTGGFGRSASPAWRTSGSCGSSRNGWTRELSRTASGRPARREPRRGRRFPPCSRTSTSTMSSIFGPGNGERGRLTVTWSS